MKTYNLSTAYEADRDLVRAYVENDDCVLFEIEYDAANGTATLLYINCGIEDFAAVNTFELIAKVTNALLTATTDETEIPMHIDVTLKIQL